VNWKSPQSRLLLKALVAAPGHQLSSEQAIEILFPGSDPAWSRKRLRDVLSRLRATLEPDAQAYARVSHVLSDRETIRLVVNQEGPNGAGVWLDCAAFEHLGSQALEQLEHGEGGHDVGAAALALYAGPFLPLDRYSDWAQRARQRYQRLWTKLIRRLAHLELERQRFSQAIAYLEQLVEDRVDDQDVVLLLMVAYVGADQRTEALKLFRTFSEQCNQELDMTPSSVLRDLHERIRSGVAKDTILGLT
jgi:DNA-binding SARP family transcriptional activator